MNIMGVQCQEKSKGIYLYNQEVRPGSIKAINITDADFWQRIWDENPRLEYAIYRECPENQPEPFDDPEGTAVAWIALLKSKVGHLVDAGLITHIEGLNEWIHSFQAQHFPAADRFMEKLIEECHEQFGGEVHIIVLNASCGHFSNDILNFPRTLAKLNEGCGCLLGLHSYDRGDLDRLHLEDIAGGGDGLWLCGKFLRVDRALRAAGYDNIGIATTEFGHDDAVQRPAGSPHRGWRHYGSTIEEAVQHLLDNHNLGWYYPLARACSAVKLLSWFGCSMYWDGNNWGDRGFDLANRDGSFPAGLIEGIKNLEGIEPPPPNGGNEMRVFDKDGVELFGSDAENLVAYYGLSTTDPVGLQSGDRYFKLTVLYEKVSTNAAFISRVLDEAGNPIVNPDETLDRSKAHRAFWWPNMGDANDIVTAFSTDWHPAADLGGLNVNGDGGSGMGSGAFHDPNTPGPHEAWIRHPAIPSVRLKGIGMIGNTNHDHMDGEWQIKPYQANGPLPNPIQAIIEHAQQIISIAGTISGSAPNEMELTYPGGVKARYTLTPTSTSALRRAWTKVKSLIGR